MWFLYKKKKKKNLHNYVYAWYETGDLVLENSARLSKVVVLLEEANLKLKVPSSAQTPGLQSEHQITTRLKGQFMHSLYLNPLSYKETFVSNI